MMMKVHGQNLELRRLGYRAKFERWTSSKADKT